MKKITAITLTSMMLLMATAMVVGAVPAAEVRGAVAGTVQGASNIVDSSFAWNPQNFAGFFYDIKKDIGNENLKAVITGDTVNVGGKLSGDSPYGLTYTTSVQQKAYERALWGAFNVIGFQAEQYFAGYLPGNTEEDGSNIFYQETTDKNSLASEQLQKILMNSKDEMTVTSGTPLKLGEGYELAVKSIDVDGNKVYLELTKDGAVVDSKVVSPSKTGATEIDKTYFYKNPKVGEQAKLVTIAVHFKNAFRGADQNLASIDGIWQISGEPTEVKADAKYGKMTVISVDSTTGTITMANKDEVITLSKNKNTEIMPGVSLKTADNETLRFYVFKSITEPGTYAIRGAVAGTVQGAGNLVDSNSFSWNPQNFAGFFYDIKNDIGNENLKAVITGETVQTGGKLSGDSPYGLTYTTSVQQKAYERALWGAFNVIGFQAEQYFAGYIQGADEATGSNIFYQESTDKNSLASEQLQKILMNSKDEMTVTSGTPLKLGEGYELAVKSIDVDGNKVYLELTKDGAVVDSKVVSPSKDGATELDKTYFYKNPQVGEQAKLVTIAVHFKNAFRGADQNLASIDGIWQISGEPTEVKADAQYGKMTIISVDSTTGTITMANKDEVVTLSKNKDVEIMPGVSLKTADNDTLRFYVYKPVTVEGAATEAEAKPAVETPAAEAKPAVEAPAAEAKPAAETAAKAAVAEKAAEAKPAAEAAVKAAVENKTAEAAGAAKEAAPAAAKKQPGFEGIFAIAGLLAVAYLVLGRKE